MPYLISAETRVNTYVQSRQSAPDTVALIGGGYVTVWSGAGPTDPGYSVYLQRHDAAGVAVGPAVLINTTAIYSQQNPVVTALASGGYAVAWDSIVPGGGNGDASALGVFVRTFDADGRALGPDVQVSGHGNSQQIASLPGGGFVVTWTHAVDYPFSGVSAQVFTAAGVSAGAVFVLDQDRDASLSSLVPTEAGFIAVWRASNDSGATIAIQSFDATGVRLGDTIRLARDNHSTTPDIVSLAEGGFAVVWQEAAGLWGQILGPDGQPSGERVMIQSVSGGAQLLHTLIATPDGGFAVAWEQFTGSAQGSIAVATFTADGARVGVPMTIRTGVSSPGEAPGLAVLPSGDLVVTYARYVGDITNYYDVFEVRLTLQSGLITGTAASEELTGSHLDDELVGLGGDDILNGGAGMDTAVYAGIRLQYSASSTSVSGGPEGGTDTLNSIEELRFVDGTLSYDVNGLAAQVMRLYDAALDRLPDQGGLEGHVRNLQTGAITIQSLASAFLNSAEFQARYGALSNQAFIEQIYRFSLDREGDAGGIAGWVANLNAGMTRDAVLLYFSESAEHRDLTAEALAKGLWTPDQDALVIARLYDATFNRLPDPYGLASWTANLEKGMPLIEIAAAFAASAEFQATYGSLSNQAFVEQIYRASLDREGDPEGIAAWVNQMNLGMSRAQVLLAFSESAEHISLTAPFWSGGIQFQGYVPPSAAAAVDGAAIKLADVQILPGLVEDKGHHLDLVVDPTLVLLAAADPASAPVLDPRLSGDRMLVLSAHDDFIPLPGRSFEVPTDWQVSPLADPDFGPDFSDLQTPDDQVIPATLIDDLAPGHFNPEPDYWLH